MNPETVEKQEKVEETIYNPFPGLRPFNSSENRLFFGREEQIGDVLGKVVKRKFVAIVGTSGIGKSSFMNCGIVPELQKGIRTSYSDQWKVIRFRPGSDPIGQLINSLNNTFKVEPEGELTVDVQDAKDYLSLNGKGLMSYFDHMVPEFQDNILIYVDQFEEIFRYKQDNSKEGEEKLNWFINQLVSVMRKGNSKIHVVLTMRSDFVGDCSAFPELTTAFNKSQFLIPRLTKKEIREAVEGPIGVMKARISEDLVQTILNDLGEDSDMLPIMQHAMMRTWDFWMENKIGNQEIDVSHYNAVGGMKTALSVHANEAFNELNDYDKAICERVFKCITVKGEEGRSVRRPTSLHKISEIVNAPINDVRRIVEHFRKPGCSLLMPSTHIELRDNTVVDISHESMIRIWTNLNNWVEDEFESVKQYLKLAEAGEMHQLGKAGLWRPPDLQLALNWRNEHKPSKAWGIRYDSAYERTMQFLEFSQKQHEKDLWVKERLQKRRLMVARLISGVLGVGAVIAFLFFLYAQQQKEVALEQKELAVEMQEKALESEKEAKEKEALALVMKQQADSSAKIANRNAIIANEKTIFANEQMVIAGEKADLAALKEEEARKEKEKADKLRVLSVAKSMAVKSLQLSDPEVKALVARQSFKCYNNNGGNLSDPDLYSAVYYALKSLKGDKYNQLEGHSQNVRVLSRNNNGQALYSAGSDGKILKWNQQNLQSTPVVLHENINQIHKAMDLSNDGKVLVSAGNYGEIQVFNVAQGNVSPTTLNTPTKETWFLALANDNKTIYSVGSDMKILKWQGNKPAEIHTSDLKINSIDVSPMGEELVYATVDGYIYKIDLTTNEHSVLFKDEEKHDFISLKYSPDGVYLAAGNENGMVYLWNMQMNLPLAPLVGHQSMVNDICFNNTSNLMATASFDHTVRVWNLNSLTEQPIVLNDHKDWVWSIEFTHNGKYLLAGCKDKLIRMWPLSVAEMAAQICADPDVNRILSKDEWNDYAKGLTYDSIPCDN